METAGVGPTVSCFWGSVRDFSLYLCRKRREALDLWDKFHALRGQVARLLNRWDDLNNQIDELSITVERSREYESVLKNVSMILDSFFSIDDRYEQLCVNSRDEGPTNVWRQRPRQKTTKMVRSCSLFAFARLYTKVNTLIAEASEVISQATREHLINQVRPGIIEQPHAEKVGGVGHPHKQYLYGVLEHIDKENCNTICVYGSVSGVGVSNILRNVNNYFLEPSSICKSKFACVIWVAVQKQESREKIIESIQKEILFRVSAPAGETRQQNSQIITSVLGKKKCLLLLDDFPADIKLEDIGIPQGKVVIATKDIRGLRTKQELHKEFKVKTLLRNESSYMFERLFFKNSGQAKLSRAEKEEVHLILRCTGGILTYIKVAATILALRRNLGYWQGVRQEVESDSDLLGMAGIRNLYEEAYGRLEEDWKKCLLFVALYPEEYVIPRNYLIECWKSLNFLRNYSRFSEMRARGEFVCVMLEDRCLLERACEKYVKMPLMFRKIATTLPYPGGVAESFVRFHPEDESVRKPWCSNAKWICGAKTNIERLPVSEKCDGLTALLLQKNAQLIYVESGLFTSIPNLLVLDLHGTGIKLLPTSISCLTKLRCLYLNECRCLQGLPGEMTLLTDLEVLDIRSTPFHCEPINISRLPGLKCLRISYATSETPSRSWSHSLEELAIEFAKGVEKSVVDHVKQEVIAGFKDSDHFKINLHSEFESYELHLKKNLSTGAEEGSITDSSYHLELTTYSPSTSGLQGSRHQAPPSENTNLNQLSDRRVSRKGKEIVEGNGAQEDSSTGSNQLPDSGVLQKGKGIVETRMESGYKKESEDEIVEEGNGKP